MALISKMNRCALCGSIEVVYNKNTGLYHCAACGKDSAELMPAADLNAVNRIAMQGDTEGKMDDLRRRYPRLNLTTWTKEDRVQF